MLAKLLFLFVAVPLLELILLIRIGTWIGFWPTVAIVVVTGVLGALLARGQGLLVLNAVRRDLASGRMPTASLLDGMLVLVGGAVLLTPGVLTDLLGILLLLPPTRALFKSRLRGAIQRGIERGTVQVLSFGGRRRVDSEDDREVGNR